MVDDNHDLAKLMQLILKKRGWDVRITFDGETAVETALEHRPNVVLLDITLPRLSGHEVAARLRASDNLKRCCIVATSGWNPSNAEAESLFDHYLVKPINQDHLQLILESVPFDESRFVRRSSRPAVTGIH